MTGEGFLFYFLMFFVYECWLFCLFSLLFPVSSNPKKNLGKKTIPANRKKMLKKKGFLVGTYPTNF